MVKRKRAGYTMIEMMIAVAIIGVIASVGAGVLIQINRYFILTSTRNDLQREARSAMYVISRELRQAQSNTIVISRVSASQPFYSSITFTKLSGKQVTFEQSGNQLLQIVGNDHDILTKHVQYLAFMFPRSDQMSIVSVSMTLQESIYQGQIKALHMASEQVQVMN